MISAMKRKGGEEVNPEGKSKRSRADPTEKIENKVSDGIVEDKNEKNPDADEGDSPASDGFDWVECDQKLNKEFRMRNRETIDGDHDPDEPGDVSQLFGDVIVPFVEKKCKPGHPKGTHRHHRYVARRKAALEMGFSSPKRIELPRSLEVLMRDEWCDARNHHDMR